MSVVQRETFSNEGLVNRLLIGDGTVLDLDTPIPYISFDLLVVILRSLSHDGLHTALKQGVVPAAWMPYRIFYAQCDGFLPVAGLQLIGKIKRADFNLAIDAVFSQRIARVAVFGLAKSAPHFSARRRITFPQAVCLLGLVDFVGTIAVFLPSGVTHHIIGLSFLIFFGSMVWLRILALGEPDITKPHEPELDDSKLPVYSVLVPMFREACVLPQLVAALRALHYPELCSSLT